MKFEDLEFKPMLNYDNGIFVRVEFPNGYGASIIKSPHSYSGYQDLYELAVLYDNMICYDTEITDDVLGYQTEEDINRIIKHVQRLYNDENN